MCNICEFKLNSVFTYRVNIVVVLIGGNCVLIFVVVNVVVVMMCCGVGIFFGCLNRNILFDGRSFMVFSS